jgi:hypothetical protein
MPLYVPLKPAAEAKLAERARRERRRPQDEAAVIIERALDGDVAPAEARSVDLKVHA